MQAAQSIGTDLPLKALVWEDENGKTWLSYNEPAWLAWRHATEIGSEAVLGAMSKALADAAREAAS
jgi:uncharacterized protein (DUF302 family)